MQRREVGLPVCVYKPDASERQETAVIPIQAGRETVLIAKLRDQQRTGNYTDSQGNEGGD